MFRRTDVGANKDPIEGPPKKLIFKIGPKQHVFVDCLARPISCSGVLCCARILAVSIVRKYPVRFNSKRFDARSSSPGSGSAGSSSSAGSGSAGAVPVQPV